MPTEQVGITITVSQAELKALVSNLSQANTQTKQSKSGLAEWASGVLKATDKVTGLHKTLRLVHLSMRLIGDVWRPIADQISKGLEFRFRDDPIMVSIRKIDAETARMRNAFVDLFAPLAVGIAKALDGVSKDVESWLKNNQKVLKEQLIGTFEDVAHVAVNTGAVLAVTATNVVLGWKMLIASLKDVKSSFMQWGAETGGVIYAGIAKGFAALNMGDLAAQFGEYGQAGKQAAKEYARDAGSAQKEVNDLAEKQLTILGLIQQAQDGANAAVDKAVKIAKEHLDIKTHTSLLSKGQQGEELAQMSKAIDEDVLRENLDHALQIQRQFEAVRGQVSHEAAVEMEKKIDDSILAIQTARLKREGATAEAIAEIRKAADEQQNEQYQREVEQQKERTEAFSKMVDRTLMEGNLQDALGLWRRFEQQRADIAREKQQEIEKTIREGIGAKVGEQMKEQLDGSFVGLLAGWQTYLSNRDHLVESKDRELAQELKKSTDEVAKSTGSSIGQELTALALHTTTVAELWKRMLDSMLQATITFLAQKAIQGLLAIGSSAISGLSHAFGVASSGAATAASAAGTAASAAGQTATSSAATAALTTAGTTLDAAGAVLDSSGLELSTSAAALASSSITLDSAAAALLAAGGTQAAAGAAQVAGAAASVAATAFAGGGLVTGGHPGRDSVPALLTPGEFVLPAEVVARVRGGALPSKPGHYSSGGYVTQQSGVSTTVVQRETTVNHNVFAPMTRADFERMYRDVILPSQARMQRLGYTSVVR